MSKEQGIDNPTLEELVNAVTMCQLRHIIEPYKMYSRDSFLLGRLKVELLQENGLPMRNNIKTSTAWVR